MGMTSTIKTLDHGIFNKDIKGFGTRSGLYEPSYSLSKTKPSPKVRDYNKIRSYSKVKEYKLKEDDNKVQEYDEVRDYNHYYDAFPSDPEEVERRRKEREEFQSKQKQMKAEREPFFRPYKSLPSIRRMIDIVESPPSNRKSKHSQNAVSNPDFSQINNDDDF